MSNDDILKVARESGLPREVVTYRFDQIITFARRIAAMQREIDAGICEQQKSVKGSCFYVCHGEVCEFLGDK